MLAVTPVTVPLATTPLIAVKTIFTATPENVTEYVLTVTPFTETVTVETPD